MPSPALARPGFRLHRLSLGSTLAELEAQASSHPHLKAIARTRWPALSKPIILGLGGGVGVVGGWAGRSRIYLSRSCFRVCGGMICTVQHTNPRLDLYHASVVHMFSGRDPFNKALAHRLAWWDPYIYDLHGLENVAGWEPYDLHDLAHHSAAGSVSTDPASYVVPCSIAPPPPSAHRRRRFGYIYSAAARTEAQGCSVVFCLF